MALRITAPCSSSMILAPQPNNSDKLDIDRNGN